jgi:hypothetical protein
MPDPAPAGLTPAPANPQPVRFDGINVQPPADLLAILPEGAARDRLRALRQRTADARSLIPEFETVREANTARYDAERALARLLNHRSLGGYELPDDGSDNRVIAARETLDTATAHAKRLAELREVRTANWQVASAALQTAETYLRGGRPGNTVFEAVEVVVPSVAKGENGLLDQIENRRRVVREHKATLHRIQSAPYPSTHVKARIREQVEVLATRGTPQVARAVELDEPVDWPMASLRANIYNARELPLAAFIETHDMLPLMAWLHKDALIAALEREIDSESDDKNALGHAEREKREAEVMGDLLAVERAECALVFSAQAQNLPIEHRSDVSPLALLGLALVTAPRGDAPATTPGIAWDLIRR